VNLPNQVKFLFEDVDYDKELLLKKGTSPELAIDMLKKSKEILADFSDLQNKIYGIIINKISGMSVNSLWSFE
jgi:hypothetical protein